MTRSLTLSMRHYSIEPKQENMLKDADFCYLLEIYQTNTKISYCIQD